MYFDSEAEIVEIAKRSHATIFVVPAKVKVEVKNAYLLRPEEKTVITIEQMREILAQLNSRQARDRFFVIRPADKMGPEAANAFLKSLEEPKDKNHFILITDSPSKLLPTVLSRAAVYILRTKFDLKATQNEDLEIKELAKRLIRARGKELVALANEIGAKRKEVRNYSLEIVGTAIEILYKSYFLTNRAMFLKKLPQFLKLYENIAKNGHIKLHIVADLI